MATRKQTTTETTTTTAFVPKIKRVVTLPVLALGIDSPVYVKFEQPFRDGRVTGREPEQDAMEAGIERPREVHVTDLKTGQMMGLIVGHTLYQVLASAYPDDGYVGKGFEITRMRGKRQRGGGNGNTYKVAELDLS